MSTTALRLAREALEEDKREHGRFDAAGFANFFPEHNEQDVLDAWHIYDAIASTKMTPKPIR